MYKALLPYHRNVPDRYGNLTVVTEWISREDYIKNLHIDPIKYIYMLKENKLI